MRAGIVGYGLAGRYFHAPNLVGAGFEIAAICTRSRTRREEANADFPQATLVSSIDEIVAEDLDLLVVASTNEVHVEHARSGLAAGIDVVVDKPLGRNYQESAELFDFAEYQGRKLSVFFNRLFDSDTLTIKKALAAGELGRVFRHESRFERYRPELNPSAWRESPDPDAGGGLLLDLQTHLIAISLDLFGPADLTHASVKSIRGGADDDVTLVLSHHNGVDSYLMASAVIGAPGPRIRLHGLAGTMEIQELDHQEPLLRKGYRPTQGGWKDRESVSSEVRITAGERSSSYPSEPGNYAAFYSQVRSALESGASMPVNRDFALDVARVIDQARILSRS